MLSIDETIQNVEKLYQAVTGRPAPQPESVYAPIPAERDPVEHVEEQLSRLLSAVSQTVEGSGVPGAVQNDWAPPVALWESEREVLLAFEVPGVQREHMELTLQGNLLTIRGQRVATKDDLSLRVAERPIGPFRRTVALPPGVKAGEMSAQMRDGLLEVRVPRDREGAGARPIPVS